MQLINFKGSNQFKWETASITPMGKVNVKQNVKACDKKDLIGHLNVWPLDLTPQIESTTTHVLEVELLDCSLPFHLLCSIPSTLFAWICRHMCSLGTAQVLCHRRNQNASPEVPSQKRQKSQKIQQFFTPSRRNNLGLQSLRRLLRITDFDWIANRFNAIQ